MADQPRQNAADRLVNGNGPQERSEGVAGGANHSQARADEFVRRLLIPDPVLDAAVAQKLPTRPARQPKS